MHIFIYIYYIYKKKEICLVKNKENVMFFIRQMSHFHTVKNMSQSVLDWPLVIFSPWKIKNVKTSHFNCCTSTSIGGSVVEFSPATRETGVRFPRQCKLFLISNIKCYANFLVLTVGLGKCWIFLLFVKFFLLQIVNKQQIQTASCFTQRFTVWLWRKFEQRTRVFKRRM